MKILLLGKDGQVGRELRRTLLPLGEVIAVGRSELDLQDLPLLHSFLQQHKPEMIVNAAAYTAVDKAESDIDLAYTINEKVPTILAEYAKNNHLLLVHYSTDYVFDGNKEGAYVERDEVNPQNVYGASKYAGELAIVKSGCDHLIFRTSWVYSIHGHNFIKTILRLAKEKDSLRVVADQYGVPTSAELIADITVHAIKAHREGVLKNGIYHLTASGITNWHTLACYVADGFKKKGLTLMLQPKDIHPITSDEYSVPAKRPTNSVLNHELLSSTLGLHMPDWRVHVDRMLEQLES